MDSHRSIAPKTLIFKEGGEANELYLIKSGEVLCLKGSKDRLIPVFVAKAQDVIGESAMIEGAPYTYTTIALTPVEMVAIPAENLKTVLKDSPSWLRDLTVTMVSRFQNTAGLIAENRILHPSIMSDEDFTSTQEVEFKKILNQ